MIDTPEFHHWFGNSQVTDAEGQPLVAYHGTNADFSQFQNIATDRFEMFLQEGEKRAGYYFTPRADEAGHYAMGAATNTGGANVIPVYLSFQNPYHANPDEFGFYLTENDKQRLQAIGHDSVIKIEAFSDGRSQVFQYIAFRPEQIKSAIGNSGSYNPGNPDITDGAVMHCRQEKSPSRSRKRAP